MESWWEKNSCTLLAPCHLGIYLLAMCHVYIYHMALVDDTTKVLSDILLLEASVRIIHIVLAKQSYTIPNHSHTFATYSLRTICYFAFGTCAGFNHMSTYSVIVVSTMFIRYSVTYVVEVFINTWLANNKWWYKANT
mgnify:CR=1 FL=1